MAVLYLLQTTYDLGAAVESYLADEKWEREHPLGGSSKGKSRVRKRFDVSSGLIGQLS